MTLVSPVACRFRHPSSCADPSRHYSGWACATVTSDLLSEFHVRKKPASRPGARAEKVGILRERVAKQVVEQVRNHQSSKKNPSMTLTPVRGLGVVWDYTPPSPPCRATGDPGVLRVVK